VSHGTLASEESAPEVRVASGADGVLLGAISIEVDAAGSRPSDDAEGLLRDWVMHGTGIDAPETADLGDATPATGSLGAAGSG
jgi:hypothetical protein